MPTTESLDNTLSSAEVLRREADKRKPMTTQQLLWYCQLYDLSVSPEEIEKAEIMGFIDYENEEVGPFKGQSDGREFFGATLAHVLRMVIGGNDNMHPAEPMGPAAQYPSLLH